MLLPSRHEGSDMFNNINEIKKIFNKCLFSYTGL